MMIISNSKYIYNTHYAYMISYCITNRDPLHSRRTWPERPRSCVSWSWRCRFFCGAGIDLKSCEWSRWSIGKHGTKLTKPSEMGSVAHEDWRFQHETGELRVSGVGDPKIGSPWPSTSKLSEAFGSCPGCFIESIFADVGMNIQHHWCCQVLQVVEKESALAQDESDLIEVQLVVCSDWWLVVSSFKFWWGNLH